MIRILLLSLAAATPSLPFPAPRLAPVSQSTKCDRATVVQVMPATSELVGKTVAGSVTYKVGSAQLISADGRPLGAPTTLKPGQRIRVYYTVGDGAVASENRPRIGRFAPSKRPLRSAAPPASFAGRQEDP